MSYKEMKRTKIGRRNILLQADLLKDSSLNNEKEFLQKYQDCGFSDEDLKEFYWAVRQMELPFRT